jgi:peptidoglycan DL-endopeptidase CwlO
MSRHGTLMLAVISLVSAGCASTGGVPRPFPAPAGSALPRDPAGVETSIDRPTNGYAIAGTALSLRGSPYRNGGSDPTGFDCSGFVWYVFGQHGIRVPRTVGEQFREGTEVHSDALQAGDLVFFSTDAPGVSHVGMAIGGDEFVHAPSSRGDVRVERFSSRYWSARYIGARRMR